MSTRVAFGIMVAIVTVVAATDIAHSSSPHASVRPPAMSTASPTAAAPTVEAMFSQAVEAVAEFGAPTTAYQQTALAAIQSQHAVPAFTAAQQIDLQAAGKVAIGRYFAGPQSAAELTALTKAMDLDASPNLINLGSGISRLAFRAVAVTSSLATVVADATVWTRSAARRNALDPWVLASPVSVVRYTATLRPSPGGTWQVTALTTTVSQGP